MIVEFFGIPRHRAGCAMAHIDGETLADVLAALARSYPRLLGLQRPDGSPSPQYLVSLDGSRFLTDPQERLEPESRLLLLSADAGG